MKKEFALFLAFAAILSSCKQHYTCSCEEQIDGVATNNNGKTLGWEASKKEANSIRCSTYESTHDVNGTTVSYICTLTEG